MSSCNHVFTSSCAVLTLAVVFLLDRDLRLSWPLLLFFFLVLPIPVLLLIFSTLAFLLLAGLRSLHSLTRGLVPVRPRHDVPERHRLRQLADDTAPPQSAHRVRAEERAGPC